MNATTAAQTTTPAVTVADFAALVTSLSAEANAWHDAHFALPVGERSEHTYAWRRYQTALVQLQGAATRLAELVTA